MSLGHCTRIKKDGTRCNNDIWDIFSYSPRSAALPSKGYCASCRVVLATEAKRKAGVLRYAHPKGGRKK